MKAKCVFCDTKTNFEYETKLVCIDCYVKILNAKKPKILPNINHPQVWLPYIDRPPTYKPYQPPVVWC